MSAANKEVIAVLDSILSNSLTATKYSPRPEGIGHETGDISFKGIAVYTEDGALPEDAKGGNTAGWKFIPQAGLREIVRSAQSTDIPDSSNVAIAVGERSWIVDRFVWNMVSFYGGDKFKQEGPTQVMGITRSQDPKLYTEGTRKAKEMRRLFAISIGG